MTVERYEQGDILDLSERVGYEMWLLEDIYKLVQDELFPTFPDSVVYALGSSEPQITTFARINMVIGDWRRGFLEAGAPLVFTTTFKLLDMFLEWVLDHNKKLTTGRSFFFGDKIKNLKETLVYPSIVQDRPWLQERLSCIYEKLEPLRGTIIHSRQFSSSDGSLHVSSSKAGRVGPEVKISAQDLRTFATLCISVVRYVDETWSLDAHKERLLRWHLDQLAHLHDKPLLRQKEPCWTTVRVFIEGDDPRIVDVAKIRNDLNSLFPRHSYLFDLRVLPVRDGKTVAAYLFPSAVLDEIAKMADVSHYRVECPQNSNH